MIVLVLPPQCIKIDQNVYNAGRVHYSGTCLVVFNDGWYEGYKHELLSNNENLHFNGEHWRGGIDYFITSIYLNEEWHVFIWTYGNVCIELALYNAFLLFFNWWFIQFFSPFINWDPEKYVYFRKSTFSKTTQTRPKHPISHYHRKVGFLWVGGREEAFGFETFQKVLKIWGR